MRRFARIFLLAAAAWLLGGGLAAQEGPTFTLSLNGPCGETLSQPPGSLYDDGTGGADFFFDPARFQPDLEEVPTNPPGHTWDVLLTTDNNRGDAGVQAWCVMVGAEGPLEIVDLTTNGTVSCEGGSSPRPRGSTCLRDRGFERSELVDIPTPDGSRLVGAASCVVLSTPLPITLPPEGTEPLLKLRVSGRFPEVDGDRASGRLFFTSAKTMPPPPADGFVLPSISFFPTHVTRDGDMFDSAPSLVLRHCEVEFVARTAARFIRCDANGDGRLQVTDAVRILNELFRGGPPTRCPAAADCNGDGSRDVSDPVYSLSYQFLGGELPPAPFPECGTGGGGDPEDCPPGSTACPEA